MMEESKGKKAIPQNFNNDQSNCGCDELYELENEGKLDLLIN